MTVDIMCQEDRLMTPFRHEIIPHTPLLLEAEVGETVFLQPWDAVKAPRFER